MLQLDHITQPVNVYYQILFIFMKYNIASFDQVGRYFDKFICHDIPHALLNSAYTPKWLHNRFRVKFPNYVAP